MKTYFGYFQIPKTEPNAEYEGGAVQAVTLAAGSAAPRGKT